MRSLLAILLVSGIAAAQGVGTVGFNLTSSGATSSALYYGPGCAGTSTNTCTIGGTSQTAFNGYPEASSFTTGNNAAGYAVTNCGVYIYAKDATNAHLRCAIYTISGTTATLVTNCGQTSDQNIGTVPGWQETAMSAGCTLAASTTYWTFFEAGGAATANRYNTSAGAGRYSTMAFGNWSSTFATGTNGNSYSAYVKVTAK